MGIEIDPLLRMQLDKKIPSSWNDGNNPTCSNWTSGWLLLEKSNTLSSVLLANSAIEINTFKVIVWKEGVPEFCEVSNK